jgi:hypothetical protein
MGMYTKFRIRCFLKRDTPDSLIQVLRHMIHDRLSLADLKVKGSNVAFHSEWSRCETARAFLSNSRYSWLGNPEDHEMFDEPCNWNLHSVDNGWYLEIGTDVKNHEQVIQKFWAWVNPWIVEAPGTPIGYCKYEEYWQASPVIVGQKIETGSMGRDDDNWVWS